MDPMLHVYYINLRNGTVYQKIAKPLPGGSINADQFEIHLQDCGRIVDLSSATVLGAVYRPDNSVVPLTAVAKDDAVLITLDKYCYAIPGMITLKVKIADEGILRTALSISMTVDEPDSAVIINNETLGTLSELVEAINSMDTAAAEAQQVVDRAREDLLTTTEEANASMQATKDAANASMRETRDAATATMEETASTANQSMAEVADTAVSSIKAAEDNAKSVLDESADKLEGYVTRTEAAEAGAKAARDQAEDFALQANLSANTANNAMGSVQLMASNVEQLEADADKSAKAAAASANAAAASATTAQAAEAGALKNAQDAQKAADRAQEVKDSIPTDYAHLSQLAEGVTINANASGSFLSIRDSANVRAVSLVSHIKPAQEGVGTPSFSNVRPVKGWDEISVICSTRNLLTYTPDDVEEFTYINKSGVTTTIRGYKRISLAPGAYKIRGAYKEGYSSGVYAYAKVLDANGTDTGVSGISPVANTTVKTADFVIHDGEYLIIHNGSSGDDVDKTISKFKRIDLGIFAADVDTSFAESKRTVHTAALSETVYGGKFDWTTGLLTVTHKGVRLTGTEAWGKAANYSIFSVSAYLGDVVIDNTATRSFCSHFNTTASVSLANMADASMFLVSNPLMRFRHDGCATTNEWKAWLADQASAGTPVEIVFELQTPYEIQLTAQQVDLLQDYTAMWSDCGNTDVTYVANTKLYIDNRLAAIAASLINA